MSPRQAPRSLNQIPTLQACRSPKSPMAYQKPREAPTMVIHRSSRRKPSSGGSNGAWPAKEGDRAGSRRKLNVYLCRTRTRNGDTSKCLWNLACKTGDVKDSDFGAYCIHTVKRSRSRFLRQAPRIMISHANWSIRRESYRKILLYKY